MFTVFPRNLGHYGTFHGSWVKALGTVADANIGNASQKILDFETQLGRIDRQCRMRWAPGPG